MVSRVMLTKNIWRKLRDLYFCQCRNNVVCNSNNTHIPHIAVYREYSTDNKEDALQPVDVTVDEEEESKLNDLRNISGLVPKLRNRMHHVKISAQYSYPDNRDSDRWKFFPREKFTNYQRRLFAKYGHDSGVDPAICWPSKEKLTEIEEEERIYEPALQELWVSMKAKIEEDERYLQDREAVIDKNLAKMPEMMRSYRKRLQKKGKDRLDARAHQSRLMTEIQDHFGYDISHSDEQFKVYKEEKYQEEKKVKKADHREKKAAKTDARMKEARVRIRKELASEKQETDTAEQQNTTAAHPQGTEDSNNSQVTDNMEVTINKSATSE